MTPLTRDLAIQALRNELEHLRASVAEKPDWYDKDWRGELHRRTLAREIVDVRRALVELMDDAVLRGAA
jgi:hypothetical protein